MRARMKTTVPAKTKAIGLICVGIAYAVIMSYGVSNFFGEQISRMSEWGRFAIWLAIMIPCLWILSIAYREWTGSKEM